MDLITNLWNSAIVGPLGEGLMLLFNMLGSWGLAIIVFTMVVKLVMLPLTMKQIRSAKAMQEVQPVLRELQKKHGNDREKLMQEQMKLYKERGVNPVAGCLPMLVQMPIWIGLYHALINLAQVDPAFARPFLWLPSLAVPDTLYLLPILTGVSQWVVQKMMTPRVVDPQQKTMNQVMQFMPLMFAFFATQVPSGLALYWVASNIFTLAQQYFTTGWGSLLPEKNNGAQLAVNGQARLVAPSTPAVSNGQTDEDTSGEGVSAARTSSRRRRSRRR